MQFKNNLSDPQWQNVTGRATVVGSQGGVTDLAPQSRQGAFTGLFPIEDLKMKAKIKADASGFTLVELLVVIVVIWPRSLPWCCHPL